MASKYGVCLKSKGPVSAIFSVSEILTVSTLTLESVPLFRALPNKHIVLKKGTYAKCHTVPLVIHKEND